MENSYEAIIDKIIDGILVLDLKGKITYANSAIEKLMGISFTQAKGTVFKKYITKQTLSKTDNAFGKALKNKSMRNLKADLIHSNGKTISIECNFTPLIKKGKQTGVLLVVRDIRKQKESEGTSLVDVHTQLYNYRYLQQRLSSEFANAKKRFAPLSLLMIDIDYFKSINDTYGYHFGDKILKQFAKLLSSVARQSDIVCRSGGEEFALILTNTDKEGAIRFAKRIQHIIKEYNFKKISSKFNISLNASIGVASFPEDNIQTSSSLIDCAAKALTSIKEKESGSICIYNQFSNNENSDVLFKEPASQHAELLRIKFASLSRKMNQAIIDSVYALAKTVGARDDYTERHSEEMAAYAAKIAKHFKLTREEIENIKHGAMLHDIGKIGISDKILLKPAKLTEKEFREVKKHPQIGADILRQVHFLKDVVPIILHHHERYDGHGYNDGLKEEKIPLGARIVATVDVYQALISDRPYRKAYSKKESIKIIKESSGSFFDPKIVKTFMAIIEKEKNR